MSVILVQPCHPEKRRVKFPSAPTQQQSKAELGRATPGGRRPCGGDTLCLRPSCGGRHPACLCLQPPGQEVLTCSALGRSFKLPRALNHLGRGSACTSLPLETRGASKAFVGLCYLLYASSKFFCFFFNFPCFPSPPHFQAISEQIIVFWGFKGSSKFWTFC